MNSHFVAKAIKKANGINGFAGQWLWSGANVIAIFVARYYSTQERQTFF